MIKQIWVTFNTYKKFRWTWIPYLLRSQTVFNRGGKMWLAPHWEAGWGPFIFRWEGYSHEKEYNGTYNEHECPAKALQDRLNVLENAIRVHKGRVGEPMWADHQLWKVLNSDGND